jgi:hypothetical protein
MFSPDPPDSSKAVYVPGAMAATASWANLSRDMVSSIAGSAGDRLSLGDYLRLRGVCTVVAGRAWQPLLSHLTRSNKEEDEHWTRDFSGPARERRRGRTNAPIFFIFAMST